MFQQLNDYGIYVYGIYMTFFVCVLVVNLKIYN